MPKIIAKTIEFTKMQGLGNDFILVEYEDVKKNNLEYSSLAQKMCDRRFGIGGDGLIIVNPEEMKKDTDTCWRIFNSDGSEPEMCGNGIRCFARYVFDKGLVKNKKFTVNTLAGTITPEILDNGTVKVDMGKPILEPSKIPTAGINGENVINHEVEFGDKKFNINAVSMGNPHCIIFTEENSAELARTYGPIIEVSSLFPAKTNVEFVNVLSRNHIKIDVWERGCGITHACGTGTCASVVAGILNNLTDNNVKADLPGGTLSIEWQGSEPDNIFMTGAAEFVFTGSYLL